MPSFELVALGCGGGPNEHNLSSYLLKPFGAPWREGIIALEAGSGIGALGKLLGEQPDLFGADQNTGENGNGSLCTAVKVYSWIKCFLVSHAHLDHIAGLALTASTLDMRCEVYGALQCLKTVEKLFSGELWPRLASWDAHDRHPLTLRELPNDATYHCISGFPGVSIRTMPLSHGRFGEETTYHSSAFFIRHCASQNDTAREFLFFGDVEPDSVATEPHNLDIWRAAASMIPDTLNTIFIECSYPIGRPDNELFGHLNPEHLTAELKRLATEVVNVQMRTRRPRSSQEWNSDEEPVHARKRQRRGNPTASLRGALTGLRVYIIHCKDDLRGAYTQPIHEAIACQVRELVEAAELGAEIIGVAQGMKIVI